MQIRGRAGERAVVITCTQAKSSLVVLAGHEGFALRLQRFELLFEPLIRGFAGIDRAADPFLTA